MKLYINDDNNLITEDELIEIYKDNCDGCDCQCEIYCGCNKPYAETDDEEIREELRAYASVNGYYEVFPSEAILNMLRD